MTDKYTSVEDSEILFVETSTTGAGSSTAKCASRMGLSPVLLTRNAENYPPALLKLFNRIEIVETNDTPTLLPVVKRIVSTSRVAGIMTTTDFYVPQTAACCHVFGYPGLSVAAAKRCHNKRLLRARLDKLAPDLNPRYFPVARTHDVSRAVRAASEIGFPLVVKPVDANDSLLIRLAQGPADVIEHITAIRSVDFDVTGQRFSGDALLEELVHEPEFSLEAFRAADGSVHFVGAFEKELSGWSHAPFIKMGAAFPPKADIINLLREVALRVVQTIEVDVGIVDIDCRFDGTAIRVLEVNGRLVGDQMGSHLVELATGESLPELAVSLATGAAVSWRPDRLEPVSIYRVPAHRGGIFHGIKNLSEIVNRPDVLEVIVLAPLGSICGIAQSNQDMMASVIARGQTSADALDSARAAANAVELVISQPTDDIRKPLLR